MDSFTVPAKNDEFTSQINNLTELNRELAESRTESAELRDELARANKEIKYLKDKLKEKIREFMDELKILKKQNKKLSQENVELEVENAKNGEELRCLKSTVWKLEVENEKLLEKVKELEKEREENLVDNKLRRDFDGLVSAIDQLRGFDQRVMDLEQLVGRLNEGSQVSSDLEPDATEIIDQEQEESFGSEVKIEGFHTTECLHNKDLATSSPPSPKEVSATCVNAHPETSNSKTRLARPNQTPSLSEAPTEVTELASPKEFVNKSPSAAPLTVDLSSSDDDGDGYLPSTGGVKRKQSSAEDSVKRQNCGSSYKYRLKEETELSPAGSGKHPLGIKYEALFSCDVKRTIEALKRCEQRAGMASDCRYLDSVTCDDHGKVGSLKKRWDCAEDLLDDLVKDAELCMKGICALHRQQQYVFNIPRARTLANFLTNGDAEGALKKTRADLEKCDSEGVGDCISIAMAHFKQLFKIYKNGNDPFFAPEFLSGHKTIT